MKLFRSPQQFIQLTVLVVLSLAATVSHAQQDSTDSRGLLWQPAQSPFTPDPYSGVVVGGPGNAPDPGSPLYVCRTNIRGSIVPGKWVRGNCNVAFGGAELISSQYELAYGSVRWGKWRGDTSGLVQTGSDIDGSPLYSCRALLFSGNGSAVGYQPGKLVTSGTCNIPFGGREILQQPPFEVLYLFGGNRPPWPNPPYPQPTALPGCRATDIDVSHNQSSGSWEGPNCSPSDGFGNINGPLKYATPPNPVYPDSNGVGQSQVAAAPPYQPGPSSVSWQPVQRPFQPGVGSIPGGPGNGPKPNAPLYICRASVDNALLPGKWIEGQCSVSNPEGREQRFSSYEIAIGNAVWKTFDGNIGALVPGGYAPDGSPEFICRKAFSFMGSKGLQPGRLENGQCHIPYAGIDHPSNPPFEALYNTFSANPAPTQ